VTAVTPKAARVTVQIRTKSGKTLSTRRYFNVTTNSALTRSFKVNLKKGKYVIRVFAVDLAGNSAGVTGSGTLTVK
jgi:hypothetical protein